MIVWLCGSSPVLLSMPDIPVSDNGQSKPDTDPGSLCMGYNGGYRGFLSLHHPSNRLIR